MRGAVADIMGLPMAGESERRSDEVSADFVELLLAERKDGLVRPLDDYLEMFPGFEDVVLRAYLRHKPPGLEAGAPSPTGGRPAGSAAAAIGAPADRRTVGRYRVIRQIGRGGQATVYLAEDARLHRRVALKVMDPGFSAGSVSVERFRREAEITSRLDHPGICTVYESGDDGGVLWIAMRYVEGETLAKRVASAREGAPSASTTAFVVIGERQETRPATAPTGGSSAPTSRTEIAELLAFFEHAAHALHAAHEAGVVHRDVKPGNLMVTPAGEPVILDFGLALDVEADNPTLTRTGDIMGTKEYMSPEQIAGNTIKLDRRTDVYSLGVSLFECLTLRRPFEAPTREGLYQAIMTKPPPDPRSLNPAIHADLRVAIGTAIEKDRDRRYQTALDFAEDLRRVRMHEPIVARPPSAATRLLRWARRNPGLAVSLGSLIAVLAGGLITALVLFNKADRAVAERNRLEDLRLASDLIDGVERFRPAWPELVRGEGGMDAWLARAAALLDRAASERRRLEATIGAPAVEAAIAGGDRSGSGAEKAAWAVAGTDVSWIDALTLESLRRTGTVERMKRRVEQRRAFALEVDARTIVEHADPWARARREISDLAASPHYGGLTLPPQRGLIPLGPDPRSRLQEFAVWGTGTIPARSPNDGTLELDDDSCVVVVLVPGGSFPMGSPVDDAGHQDSEALHVVTLDPFFIGKHEVTQAQAVLMSEGTARAGYHPGRQLAGPAMTVRHPMESVTWFEASGMCQRFGLALPTEAQWEYACRAGTRTPWSCGASEADLNGAANLFDASAVAVEPMRRAPDTAAWDDGYPYHAPTGTLRPNPFGLFDVHGNVLEWCSDTFFKIALSREDHRPGDGLLVSAAATVDPEAHRAARGGSHYTGTSFARSARRLRFPASARNQALGFRVARAVLR
jgi:serine/threonine protein kinase/formylglycine-generating enzyme required for sulfatase activity